MNHNFEHQPIYYQFPIANRNSALDLPVLQNNPQNHKPISWIINGGHRCDTEIRFEFGEKFEREDRGSEPKKFFFDYYQLFLKRFTLTLFFSPNMCLAEI